MLRALQIIAGNGFARITTLSLLACGVTVSATMPYQSLYAVKELGMTDAVFSLFMFAVSVMSVICAVSLGALSDGMTNRKPLVLWLAACGVLGYGLIYWSANMVVFMILMLTLVPLTRAVFSLLFSGIRRELDGFEKGDATAVNSMLRAIFALSWILVPGIVAWWLKDSPTLAPIYLVAAIASLVILAAYSTITHSKAAMPDANRLSFFATLKLLDSGSILIRILIVALGNGAHALHSALHPLIMTGPVGGTIRDVGIFAGLLAALEIPFMLFWAHVAQRRSISFALSAALLIYSVYAVLLSFATAPWQLFALGILNSCGAAAVLSLPMSYFQDMIADRPGLSTSLVQVMIFVGAMMSSAGFALGTALGDYSSTAWIIALMSLAGAIGLILLERKNRTAHL
jgi:MFS family permease